MNQADKRLVFVHMARSISAKWKAVSEYERNYYKLLEKEDKQRFECEMKAWHQQVEQEKMEHARFIVFSDPIDLPESLDSVFDEEMILETSDVRASSELNNVVTQSQATPPIQDNVKGTNCVGPDNVPAEFSMISDTESEDEAGRKRKLLETVYEDMPLTLLGDIGDDAPWPF
eukprot:scaffold2715_cov170-Amphora_coffeaeformis.AAC.3